MGRGYGKQERYGNQRATTYGQRLRQTRALRQPESDDVWAEVTANKSVTATEAWLGGGRFAGRRRARATRAVSLDATQLAAPNRATPRRNK